MAETRSPGAAQFAIDHVAGTFVVGEGALGKESGERNNSQQFAPRQIVVLHRRNLLRVSNAYG